MNKNDVTEFGIHALKNYILKYSMITENESPGSYEILPLKAKKNMT